MNSRNTCSSKKADTGINKRLSSFNENQIKALLIVFGVILFDLDPKDTCKKFDVPYRTYTSMCKRIISIIG